MKTSRIFLIAVLAIQSATAYAIETPAEMVNDFNPLISRVRGAIRYQIENGKGCLPWVILAKNPKDEKTFTNFGFNQEMVNKLGSADRKTIGKLYASAASNGGFTMSVIGTCEMDSSINDSPSPNIIALVLERRDGAAVQMRFPFQQGSDGKVSYIENKASFGPTDPLVLGSSNWAAAQQSIAIVEQEQSVEITVPVAKLVIRIPKANFRRLPRPDVGGATASPRYFVLYDEIRNIRLSGWFEPSSAFVGVKDIPPSVLNGKTIAHKNVAYKKIGDWDTVEFDDVDDSIKLNMANIKAHLVRAGSWVELHLSINSLQPLTEKHELLADFLRSIQVFER